MLHLKFFVPVWIRQRIRPQIAESRPSKNELTASVAVISPLNASLNFPGCKAKGVQLFMSYRLVVVAWKHALNCTFCLDDCLDVARVSLMICRCKENNFNLNA
jgi:hypothetical protein